jgi:hypothetical protein
MRSCACVWKGTHAHTHAHTRAPARYLSIRAARPNKNGIKMESCKTQTSYSIAPPSAGHCASPTLEHLHSALPAPALPLSRSPSLPLSRSPALSRSLPLSPALSRSLPLSLSLPHQSTSKETVAAVRWPIISPSHLLAHLPSHLSSPSYCIPRFLRRQGSRARDPASKKTEDPCSPAEADRSRRSGRIP